MITIMDKITEFAALVEQEQLRGLKEQDCVCEANIENRKTSVKMGVKFARVDVGTSGKYMVDLATGEIYGIKGYGVVHRGHRYGTLDTIHEWDWSDYHARKL